MGYVLVIGKCGQCGKPFSFNPRYVVSKDNIPFCRECVEAANPVRIKNGLDPIHIHSEAYEPLDEASF